MGISDHIRDLRAQVGTRLLLLPGVAAVIRDQRGRVLFLRRADNGAWGLPAGAVDPGETPAEAVAREAHEETGLDGESLELRWFAPDEAPPLPLGYPRSLLTPSQEEAADFQRPSR
jgi:8-oxo-dGTP pyrophosphatase MutT (NUDIX family)